MLGFALVKDIGRTAEGVQCAELTAFCIHPLARGAGRGDSLLDFLEQVRGRADLAGPQFRACEAVRSEGANLIVQPGDNGNQMPRSRGGEIRDLRALRVKFSCG